MATKKEEVILEFSVEQGNAITELEKTKKQIIQLKQEQQNLQKAYKKGEVTIEEYAKETVRLEGVLKKQQSTYLNVQKSVTGVKTQLDKLIDSNKSIAKSFDDTSKNLAKQSEGWKGAVGQIQVYGTSVQDAGTKLTAFANPATATVAAIGLLTAAYAKSSSGAKDFAFAQDRLNFIVTKGIEEFGKLVSGGSGEQGSGPLNKLVSFWGTALQYMPGLNLLFRDQIKAIFDESETAAQAAENLRKLEVAQKSAAGAAKFYEQEAEKNRRIRDDDGQSLAARIRAAGSVDASLTASGAVRLNVLQMEIQAIKEANVNWQNQDTILAQIADKRREMSDINEEIFGKQTENTTALKGLTKQFDEFRAKVNSFRTEEGAIDLSGLGLIDPDKAREENQAEQVKALEDFANEQIRIMHETADAQRETDEERKKSSAERAKWQIAQDKLVMQSTSELIGSVAMLAEEGSAFQKGLALVQIGIDTAEAISALTAASEQNPLNGVTFGGAGTAQFIAGLAKILSNIAMAKQYLGGFAEGGYTGHGGKYDPAGVVHKGEVVFNQDDVAALGGPRLVDRMRPTYGKRGKANLYGGYYNGGLVQGAEEVNNSLASANAIKRMPSPKVSWTEGREVGRRVEWAENQSRL